MEAYENRPDGRVFSLGNARAAQRSPAERAQTRVSHRARRQATPRVRFKGASGRHHRRAPSFAPRLTRRARYPPTSELNRRALTLALAQSSPVR